MDERLKLLHLLARAAGVLQGPHECFDANPLIEVDEDVCRPMPLSPDGQVVYRLLVDTLREYGQDIVPLTKLGS